MLEVKLLLRGLIIAKKYTITGGNKGSKEDTNYPL